MELLLEADPDTSAVTRYLDESTILVASKENSIIGVAVLIHADEKFELKNIVVRDSHQGQGVAKNLISAIKDKVKCLGGDSLYVGTGNSSLSQLALYQKCGFRMEYIEKNFFSDYPEDIYENGIRCLDMVVLCAKL
mgnify:CR=1 FL=1